jgi:hypothetical protein
MDPTSRREIRSDPLRPLNVPRPICVVVQEGEREGEPEAVQIGRQMRPVACVRDRWRVDDRWWTEQPVVRIYYELELEGGEVRTLFHDPLEDRWYEQRVG